MAYDFKALKESTDILAVIERYEKLKKDGPHYRCCCPFHNEDTASMVVTPGKNIWKCFGCGKGGDVFDFLTNYGYTYKEAVAIVTGNDPGVGVAFPVKKLSGNTRAPKIWKQAVPRQQPTEINHYRYGVPIAYWPYHNHNGVIVSYDCRFEYTDEKTGKLCKDVLPLTFCTDGKDEVWRWQGMDKPRSLSNLHLILKHPDKPIVIVEGKKTAAAAERLLKNPIITTWQGGGNAVKMTDWSALKGRKVTIWQDNDWPGYKAAIEIADIIRNDVEILRFLHNPEEAEKGWDAADAEAEGWTPERTRDYVIRNAFDLPQKKEAPPKEGQEVSALNAAQNEAGKTQGPTQGAINKQGDVLNASKQPGTQASTAGTQPGLVVLIPETVSRTAQATTGNLPGENSQAGQGSTQNMAQGNGTRKDIIMADGESHRETGYHPDFRFLGFISSDGKLHHCFYSNITRTVIKMSASGMGKAANLIELAPLDYWEEYFSKKEGFNHAAAVNFLISTSNKKGIFRHQNIRGRGAWIDEGNVVVHNGDSLIVNGKYADLSRYKGKYIYEQGLPLGFKVDNPLSTNEAAKFLDLCNRLKWERNINGYLLAGWCVIAPVCGALKWRPHIWITGGAGSGKTWVLDSIVKPMLGETSLCVQGATSEAGLRQTLRRDALSVVFDEAEGENKNDQDRMQSVLTLMRSASSEDGGNIVKGTSSSGAESYQIRSCFAFASIALQLSQQSDRTRITILELNTPGASEQERTERQQHFANLAQAQHSIINDEYRQRLQARTIRLLPTILENARTFASAAAAVLGQQRAGDQLGALLAGAYSLRSDKTITYEAAVDWLKGKDWSEESALVETRDEHSLFTTLMDTVLRVEGSFSTYDRSVGELIRIVLGIDREDTHVAVGSSEMSLKRFGIAIDKGCIVISNSAKGVKKALENTAWAKNHNNILIRIPGAEKIASMRFGSGVTSRAVAIPIKYFTE